MVANNGGGAGQPTAGAAAAAETIPLQNIMAAGGDNTLRRQFQGSVYQCVGQRDDQSNYSGTNNHHYETASDLQQWVERNVIVIVTAI